MTVFCSQKKHENFRLHNIKGNLFTNFSVLCFECLILPVFLLKALKPLFFFLFFFKVNKHFCHYHTDMYLCVKFFCHPQKLFISMHLIVVCLPYVLYFIFSLIATDGINNRLGILKRRIIVSNYIHQNIVFKSVLS